jgi:hypothetical protein
MIAIGLRPGARIWIDQSGKARAKGLSVEEALEYAQSKWLVDHKETYPRYAEVQDWAALAECQTESDRRKMVDGDHWRGRMIIAGRGLLRSGLSSEDAVDCLCWHPQAGFGEEEWRDLAVQAMQELRGDGQARRRKHKGPG